MTIRRMTTPFCLHQCGRSGALGGEYCAFGRAVASACMEEVPDMAALEVTHSAPNNLDDSLRRPEPRHPCVHCPAEQPMQHQFQLPRSEARRRVMAFRTCTAMGPAPDGLVPLVDGAGCALQVPRLRLEGDALLDRLLCASATVAVSITTVASA